MQSAHKSSVTVTPFPCHVCGTTFSEIRDLSIHIQRRHSEPEPVSTTSISEEIKAYFKYICEQNHEIIEDVHGMKNAVTLSLTEIVKNQDDLRAIFNF